MKKSGFTIIEILIVVVVISILAILVVTSYSSIVSKAGLSSLQADLTNNSKKLKLYQSQYGTYPTAFDSDGCPTTPTADNKYCLVKSGSNTIQSYTASVNSFNLKMNKDGKTYQITESSSATLVTGSVTFATSISNTGSTNGDVVVNSDGSYVVVNNVPGNGGIMSKFDSSGGLIWSKKSSGPFRINAITKTSDGGYALTGTYNDAYGSAMLMKTDSSGNITWTKLWAYGTTTYTYTNYGVSIVQTSDGGYAIEGYTSLGSSAIGFLLRFDSAGTLTWSRSFTWSSTYSWGGFAPGRLIQTSDGGFALTGFTNTYGAGPINGTSLDMYLLKFDSTGALSWSRTWGDAGATESGTGLVQTSDGGIVVSGSRNLVKFNPSGSLLWAKNTALGNFISNSRIIINSSGGLTVAGSYTADYNGSIFPSYVMLADYGSDGSLNWTKTFSPTGSQYNQASGIVQTSDNGFAVSGSTSTSGAYSTLFLKFNNNGDIVNCGGLCASITPTSSNVSKTLGTTPFTVTTPTATVTTASQTNNNYAPTISPIISN